MARSDFEVKLDGFSEIFEKLDEVGIRTQRYVASGAVRAGSQYLRKQIAASVPVHTGNLRESIKIKRLRGSDGVTFIIGPQWPKGAHANIVEYGTGVLRDPEGNPPGSKAKGSQAKTHRKPQPFMRGSFWQHGPAAVQKILSAALRLFNKEMDALGSESTDTAAARRAGI